MAFRKPATSLPCGTGQKAAGWLFVPLSHLTLDVCWAGSALPLGVDPFTQDYKVSSLSWSLAGPVWKLPAVRDKPSWWSLPVACPSRRAGSGNSDDL